MVEGVREGERGSRDTRGRLGSEQGRGTGCITSCYLLVFANNLPKSVCNFKTRATEGLSRSKKEIIGAVSFYRIAEATREAA